MDRTTLTGIVSQYATHLQAEMGIREGTRGRYVNLARGLLARCSADPESLFLPVDWAFPHLDRRVVETYLNTLKAERHWKPMSEAYYITALSAFFRFLLSRHHISVNPCAEMRPRLDGTLETPPQDTAEAVLRLFDAPSDTVDGARTVLLLELLYGAGLKPSQVYSASAVEADPPKGIVRVQTGERWHEIALSPEGIARVERYGILRTETLRALAGSAESPEPAAFWIDRRGRRCSPARMARQISRTMRAAGLSGGPASLRILAARHFGEGGADIRSVQQLLGARRLGQLDRFQPSSDLKQLMKQFRRAHPRQSSE